MIQSYELIPMIQNIPECEIASLPPHDAEYLILNKYARPIAKACTFHLGERVAQLNKMDAKEQERQYKSARPS